MIAAMRRLTIGQGITQRAVRSSAFHVMGFGFSQVLRLASNLILTRLLFPEAFGMMAMVTVFVTGLALFSDVGLGPAIMQSRRGDDRDFLNTAWTIQIIRGGLLWLAACAMTWPVSVYFGEPDLIWYLPVAALGLLISGFRPSKFETANRHMRAGRVTLLEMCTQLSAVASGILLAFWWQSVWALVISGLISAAVQVVLFWIFLPGGRNRLRWEPAAVRELINFGKWIFLSTICGFAITQADKVIIGGYLTTHDFGIYNIGFFWATFPLILGRMVVQKVMIPVYRESPPAASATNFARLRKMRFAATAGLVAGSALLAFAGVWLVEVLYDPRYAAAGGIVVLLAALQIPVIIGLTYDQAALAAGDSRRFFWLAAIRAVLVVAGMLVGIAAWGLPGALVGQAAAMLAAHPVAVWLAVRQRAWDPLHDLVFAGLGAALAGLAIWANRDAVAALAGFALL